jgi:hypothetical protein
LSRMEKRKHWVGAKVLYIRHSPTPRRVSIAPLVAYRPRFGGDS